MEQKGSEEQDLPPGVVLKEGEKYVPFKSRPELSEDMVNEGYILEPVLGVNPMKPQEVGGWKIKPPKKKSLDDEEEGFGKTEVWRHQDQDYKGDEAKRRKALGIPDPVPVDDD